jgi:histidinol-phosphatase
VIVVTAGQAELADDLDLAKRLAVISAEVALGFHGAQVHIETKADGTPVSEADLAVERALISELRRLRPGDGYLSEESGRGGPDSTRVWIIDPIDGTKAFLAEEPHWGTHVALEQDGEIVLGVVSRPVTGTQWWAGRGLGAYRSDLDPSGRTRVERVSLSPVQKLNEARISGWKVDWMVDPLLAAASWFDCAYNELTLVLEGKAEILVVPGHVWDHAPFVVLLQESGGSFLNPDGGHRLERGLAYYTNGAVDSELAQALGPEGMRPPDGATNQSHAGPSQPGDSAN